jgi:hypothetical protein
MSDKSNNSDNILDNLQNYMLTNNFINKYSHSIPISNPIISQPVVAINSIIKEKTNIFKNKNILEEKTNKFIPKEKDKLFWCFYIFLYGFEKYELAKVSLFKTEKDFKIASIEKLRLMKDKLKQFKIKINEIEDEYINKQIISIKGLYVLCLLYDINLIYIKDRTYYEINLDKDINNKLSNIIINEKNYIRNSKIFSFFNRYISL